VDIEIAYISKYDNLGKVKSLVSQASVIGLDTETTSLDPISGRIRLLQVAALGKSFVIDLFKIPPAAVKEEFLDELMQDESKVKIFQNAKFDLKFFAQAFGVYTGLYPRMVFDTFLAGKLLYAGKPIGAGLDDLMKNFLGTYIDKKLQISDWSGPLYKEQISYAGMDAAILHPLFVYQSELIRDGNLMHAARLEFGCAPAVARMELDGFKIDRDRWLEKCQISQDEAYLLEKELRGMLGNQKINFSSHPQMTQLLSEMAGVPVTGTSADYLQAFLEDYQPVKDMFGNERDVRPFLLAFLRYRKEQKDLSSFGTDFLKFIHKKTGRVHANFNQMGADATHRFSCSDPNLQQMPNNKETRSCFVAEAGNKLITSDISQIELRILADQTLEPSLREAFLNNVDVHLQTAAAQFKKPLDKVSKEERDYMKPINYGVPYGMGAKRLAYRMGIELYAAKDLLKKYYRTNTRIVDRFKVLEKYFQRYSCVRSASGRARLLDEWVRGDDEYFRAIQASKNFPIQATCADMVKRSLVRLHWELDTEDKLCGTVHDELIVETKEEGAVEKAAQINRIMTESCEEYLYNGTPVTVGTGDPSDCWEK
jgi:DNA polymerase-1